MAAARGGFRLPIFRPKRSSLQRRHSSSASTHIPLLQKLLKAPVSRIKSILDSEFTSDSTHFPWPALLSSLNNSAPHKANLIMEWKLEKLTAQDRKSHDCYARLISLCENIRNLPTALLIFSSMEAHGVGANSLVFNALISTSLSLGNFITALSLFEIMEGSESYRPDSDTYDAFISAYSNSGNKNATESWLTAKRASGFSVDAQTYGFLIRCCIKSRAFVDAQRYFEEMMLEGLMPDESTFQDVLLMYCTQRSSDKVYQILKFMTNGGMKIDQFTCRKIVDLYCEVRTVEELEELLEMMTKSNQTSDVLSLVHCSVIRVYAEKDRLDDVEYCVGRMLSRGISFSCDEDVEKVICSYFRKEAYERLDIFLDSIRDSYKLGRSTFDLLGAGYRRAGLLEKLEMVVKEMRHAGLA